MKPVVIILGMFSLISLLPPGQAADKPKGDDEVADAFAKIAALGRGVHAIKKDSKGRITSFVVVGQARVSTALGKAKGLEVARDKAKLDASGELVKWLSEKVSVRQTSDEETILFTEGAEGGGANDVRESGKAVEKTTKKIESVAQGLVRGLQVLHTEVNAEDKTYTTVLGWDAKMAKATEGVERSNGVGTPGNPVKPADKALTGKTTTSPDAKRFLP